MGVIKDFISASFLSASFVPFELMSDSIKTLEMDLQQNAWDSLMTGLLRVGDEYVSWEERDGIESLEVALESVQHVFELQCCTLQHFRALSKEVTRWLDQIGHCNDARAACQLLSPFMTEQGIVALFQSTRTIMVWLPLCKRFYMSDAFLSGTSQLSDPFIVRSISDQIRGFVCLSLSTVQLAMEKETFKGGNDLIAKFMADNAVAPGGGISSDESLLCNFIRCFLLSTDVLVVSQMFDLIHPLLAVEENYASNEWFRNFTWQHLHMDYNVSTLPPPHLIGSLLPRAFLHCILPVIQIESPLQEVTDKAMMSVLRIAVKSSEDLDENTLFIHNLLIHWSYETVNSNMSRLCEDFDALTNDLRLTLIAMDHEASTKPRKKARKATEKTTLIRAMLGSENFALFYDVLFHLIIATLAIHEIRVPGQDMVHDCSSPEMTTSANKEQYHESSIFVTKCFGNLLQLFTSNFQYFPKGILASTIKGCLNAIKICENLVHKIAKMMNTTRGITDSRRSRTAAKPLEILIGGIKVHCRDRISVLCSSALETDVVLSREDRRALSNLAVRTEKMGKFLLSMETNCSLLPSALMLLPGVAFKGPNQKVGEMNNKRKVSRVIAKRRITSTGEENLSVKMKSSPDSDGDDSFGVTGDWGD